MVVKAYLLGGGAKMMQKFPIEPKISVLKVWFSLLDSHSGFELYK